MECRAGAICSIHAFCYASRAGQRLLLAAVQASSPLQWWPYHTTYEQHNPCTSASCHKLGRVLTSDCNTTTRLHKSVSHLTFTSAHHQAACQQRKQGVGACCKGSCNGEDGPHHHSNPQNQLGCVASGQIAAHTVGDCVTHKEDAAGSKSACLSAVCTCVHAVSRSYKVQDAWIRLKLRLCCVG